MARAMAHGRAANLSKFDIESAYRMVPVHPEDRHLLGMEWKGKLFIDTTLTFGLCQRQKYLMNWLTRCSGSWSEQASKQSTTLMTSS